MNLLKHISWDVINDYVERDLLIMQKHPRYDLWILNYSKTCQYEKAWDDVTLSCRGLVVNSEGKIIARPFVKFFNKEELETEGYMDLTNIGKIPYNLDFEVYDKMDGSLGLLFNYRDEWIFASRGSFESDQAVRGKKILDTIENGYRFLEKSNTYVFEIIYPENRIVVDYGNDEDVVLLGVIDTEFGTEMSWDEMVYNHSDEFNVVSKHNFTPSITVDDLKSLEEDNKEGFVIRFSNGFRMKVKFEEYCRLHRIVTNVSNKTIWESLKNDEGLDEILDRVPDEFYDWVRKTEKELKDSYKEIELSSLRTYAGIIRNVMEGTGVKLTRDNKMDYKKAFALQAKEHKNSGILFSMFDGKDYSGAIWKMIKPEYSKPFTTGNEEEL